MDDISLEPLRNTELWHSILDHKKLFSLRGPNRVSGLTKRERICLGQVARMAENLEGSHSKLPF